MRTVVRNSFARHTIKSEYVPVNAGTTCTECGSVREKKRKPHMVSYGPILYLYRFHVDDDQGARTSGPIIGGKLFCSRSCAESYSGQSFDETRGAR